MNNAIQNAEEEKIHPALFILFGILILALDIFLLMNKTVESWNDYPLLGQQAAVIVECMVGFTGLAFVLKGINHA